MSTQKPDITALFDDATNTISYVVADPASRKCAIIDSVLDYDQASGRTSTTSADKIIAHVRDNNLSVEWILETHVHADHLSAAPLLRDTLGGKMAIAKEIVQVQEIFGKVFNAGSEFQTDGGQFDHLFTDNEDFSIGDMPAKTLHTPGHTPACMTFIFGDAAFVGDAIFMPDVGTGRTDFPGGDARTLFKSSQKLLSLPQDMRLFMGHDYTSEKRTKIKWETTVVEQRTNNIHLKNGTSEDEFVKMRESRDATLSMPKLILPSVQVNMRAGEMPPVDDNGTTYLKIPINAL